MKAIIIALLLTASLAVSATEEFTLKFIDKLVIVNDENDWVFVADENKAYNFHVSKDSIGTKKNNVFVHSRVEFFEGKEHKFDALQTPIKRIFSFGMVDCEYAIFYLVADFFVDVNNRIVHSQEHEPNEYQVELKTPNTARNKMYQAVCNIK